MQRRLEYTDRRLPIGMKALGMKAVSSDEFRYSLALCFFLTFAENVLPHPVPFLRYGFANIALIMASKVLKAGEFFLLVLCKLILASFFSANLLTPFFAISFVSNVVVFALVFACRNIRFASFFGISVVSSFSYNVLQSLMLSRFVFGNSSDRILTLLIAFGNFTGALTGFASNRLFPAFFVNSSKSLPASSDNDGPSDKYRFSAKMLLGVSVSLSLVFFLNMLNYSDEVIASVAGFKVTQGALALSLRRTALVLAGYAMSIAIRMFFKPTGSFISHVMALCGRFATNFFDNENKNGGKSRFEGLMDRLERSLRI